MMLWFKMEKEDNRKYLYELHKSVLRDLDGKELPGYEAVKILNQQREQIKELEKQVELKQKFIDTLFNYIMKLKKDNPDMKDERADKIFKEFEDRL